MKVLLIHNAPLFSTKAFSIYFQKIAMELAKIPEMELIVISSDEEIEEVELPFRVEPISGKIHSTLGNIKFIRKASKKIRQICKEEKVDIIHTLYPFSSIGAAKLSKCGKQAKIIYEIRSPWIDIIEERGYIPKVIRKLYSKLSFGLEKFFMRDIDGFIFITEALHQHYRKYLPKIHDSIIIPSGFDATLFSEKNVKNVNIKELIKADQDAIILGYIGALEKERAFEELIDHFAYALRDHKNLHLVFVGEGTGIKGIKDKTKELNIEDKVTILKPVNHKDIPSWINSFDICISHVPDIPIYHSSFPLKIVEYTALKKPVLATVLPVHTELLERFMNGFLYSNNQSFVEGLENILANEYKFKQIEDLATYSYCALAQQIHSFYKLILKS